jgi:hypothetical protein
MLVVQWVTTHTPGNDRTYDGHWENLNPTTAGELAMPQSALLLLSLAASRCGAPDAAYAAQKLQPRGVASCSSSARAMAVRCGARAWLSTALRTRLRSRGRATIRTSSQGKTVGAKYAVVASLHAAPAATPSAPPTKTYPQLLAQSR